MICPQCKENRAHRSRRSGLKDWLASLTLRTPYRCRACKKRYYVYLHGYGLIKLRTAEERSVIRLRRGLRARQIKREILGYGISSLILVVIMYFLFQQRNGGQ
jgi:hypothetical protein